MEKYLIRRGDQVKYKNIVFDIDGTLIDTEQPILSSLQKVILRHQNKMVALDELRFALGIPGKETLEKLGIDDLEGALLLWDEYYQQYLPQIHPFPGVEPVLRALKAKSFTLGIITSKTKREYQNDFCQLGLAHYFDYTICAEDSIKHKPDPEPMIRYLERAKAHSDEVLFVGDSIYDMQCAQGAGVDCALALWGCRQPQGIRATYYLKCPQDLLAIINGE